MKFRTEWKYYCNNSTFNEIESRIKGVLDIDSNSINGRYYVHSLYFDDYRNSCMQENDAGLSERHKWRIRYYNDNTNYICLEKKEKSNFLCKKYICPLNLEEYNKIINNDLYGIIFSTHKDLLKSFCIESISRILRPTVLIDYERIAFVNKALNIRVTYDTNITGSNDVKKFFDGDYSKFAITQSDIGIFEIKFDDILPGYIKKLVNNNSLNQITFSKYYTTRSIIERG